MTTYVESPQQSPPSFALSIWQQGSPTPGTSAVIADADPNSVAPPSGRILTLSPRPGTLMAMGVGNIRVVAIGGTSILYTPHFYDATVGAWVRLLSTTSTITLATAPIGIVALTGTWPGAKFFLQIVTVNGTVIAFGYDWF